MWIHKFIVVEHLLQQGTPVQISPHNNDRTALNNGDLLTTSEPALVSPSRTPKLTADSTSTEERTTLLQTTES